jgi:hypothetical protein
LDKLMRSLEFAFEGMPWLARTAAVRADRRLRKDEKRILAQSAIFG